MDEDSDTENGIEIQAPKVVKPKRVMTEKQKEAVAKNFLKAKEIRASNVLKIREEKAKLKEEIIVRQADKIQKRNDKIKKTIVGDDNDDDEPEPEVVVVKKPKAKKIVYVEDDTDDEKEEKVILKRVKRDKVAKEVTEPVLNVHIPPAQSIRFF